MKIAKKEVLHVAHLARLDLPEAQLAKFAAQIGQILEYVDMLKRVDTDGVAPTSHAIALTNALREDEVREHLEAEKALANAPQQDDGSFLVPRVIEG